ncbi:hypothetical protein ACIBQX_25705 [Nonomuraea sp. NPDC049714]|uniref:hypothetical protein n=1 Tax=Nonomuraea sp. NPDC049714 TaxID=3364357 RepID=UPI0037877E0B
MRKTLALAVAAVALTGCGMLPGQPGGGGGEEKQQATAQQQPTTEQQPTQEQSGRPLEQSAAPQADQVIATRETKVASGAAGAGGTARADVTVLKRQGKTVTLNWTLTVVDGEVNMHNGMGSATLDYSVSGVSLIDPLNAKRYRVARNGTGSDAQCVCSDTQGEFLKKGQTVTLYALFAAPPADVTKVNIEMPMIGVFTDVPIS